MKQSSEHDDHLVLLARIKFKYINITIKNGHVIEHCRNMASLGYWAEQVDKVNRSQQSCQHTPKLDCGDDDDPAFRDRREQKNTIIKHLYNSAKTLFQLDRVQDENIYIIRQRFKHAEGNLKSIARQKIVLITTKLLFIWLKTFSNYNCKLLKY